LTLQVTVIDSLKGSRWNSCTVPPLWWGDVPW